MTDIYLVNPNEKEILDNAGDRIPLGLLSIATQAKRRGKDVKVFDLNHTSEEEFLDSFERDNPKSVGISVYTSPIYAEAIRLARLLKGRTKLIAGGYHATTMPESLLPYFETVVKGEGENTILTAIDQKGIIEKDPPELDKLLPLDFSMIDLSKYGLNQEGKRTSTLITSRGCPYLCSFCGNMNRKVRFSKLENVLTEIKTLEANGFESLYFVDDLFTFNRRRMDDIIRKVSVSFRATTRANFLNEQVAENLGRYGCELLSIGIESGSDEILDRVNKREKTKDITKAVELAKKNNIKVKGFFIIGLPGETEKTARQTIDFAEQLRDKGLSYADFYYLVPFPGTPIWEYSEYFGIRIKDRNFTKYLQAGKKARCVIETRELSSERIEELVKEAQDRWRN